MAGPKYAAGERLYYKPGDFAPLQASAGGQCIVIRPLHGIDGEPEYLIELADEPGERIVKERELTTIGR
jgi:hypothetical protein